jgi:hypothetical protein
MNALLNFRDRLPVPQLIQLFDYWDSKRRCAGTAPRRWPARHQIDPVEMRFALGNIDLITVSYDPLEFRFRISGTNIDRDEGFDMQGKTLEEYPLPLHRERIRQTYLRVLQQGDPDFDILERDQEGQAVYYARILLPLSDDGTRIDGFLAGRYSLRRLVG